MAYTTLPGGLWFPNSIIMHSDSGANSSIMDATGERVGMSIVVPKTGTLDKFEFRMGTFTQATNGIRLSFQDPDATGFPDGTQDQFRDIAAGSLASNTWIVPGLMTSDGTDGGVKRSVTAGQRLWCVIEFVTFVAADNIRVSSSSVFGISEAAECSFALRSGGGPAWAHIAGNIPNLALKYNDATYGAISAPNWTTFNTTTFNSGSTPDERALIWQLPFNHKIDAVQVQMSGVAGGRTWDVVLYDSDGTTPLETQNWDSIFLQSGGQKVITFLLSQEFTMLANTDYRLAIKPTTGSSISVYDMTVQSTAHLAPFQPGATAFLSTRTDAGAWTPTDTRRPLIGVRLSAIEGAASSDTFVFNTQSPMISYGGGMVGY